MDKFYPALIRIIYHIDGRIVHAWLAPVCSTTMEAEVPVLAVIQVSVAPLCSHSQTLVAMHKMEMAAVALGRVALGGVAKVKTTEKGAPGR